MNYSSGASVEVRASESRPPSPQMPMRVPHETIRWLHVLATRLWVAVEFAVKFL